MLTRYIAISSLLLITCNAESAMPLTTPQNVKTAAEKNFTTCIKAATQYIPKGNQLISDGLSACYAGPKSILMENIERATTRIEQNNDATCRKLYSELEEKWNAYNEAILQVESLSEAPLNTNDDLEILLLGHRYEIAYSIANNSACN